VSRPPSHKATVANSPIGLWACTEVVKVPATVTSAEAMAASTSPRCMSRW
jgi:hypothetical protein